MCRGKLRSDQGFLRAVGWISAAHPPSDLAVRLKGMVDAARAGVRGIPRPSPARLIHPTGSGAPDVPKKNRSERRVDKRSASTFQPRGLPQGDGGCGASRGQRHPETISRAALSTLRAPVLRMSPKKTSELMAEDSLANPQAICRLASPHQDEWLITASFFHQ
jgi:hypothetical protein